MGGSSGRPGGGYKGNKNRPSGLGGVAGGSGSGGESPCSITILTSLASPNPAVVKTLKPKDILAIQLQMAGATPIVVAVTTEGDVAGSIAGIPHLRTLIACLQEDVSYEFEVVEISGGRVDGLLRNIVE